MQLRRTLLVLQYVRRLIEPELVCQLDGILFAEKRAEPYGDELETPKNMVGCVAGCVAGCVMNP